MSEQNIQDPFEFLKGLWGSMNMPMPGMVTPTLDTDELEKRIKDLKAVEGWLKMNLATLQMTIQGLEVQRGTLVAMQAMSQSATNPESSAAAGNALSNAALWPWQMMQQAAAAAQDAAQGVATATKPAAAPAQKPKAPRQPKKA